MGKRRYKGKYKGKRGKIDYIEDIIGTEPLSGTYEDRKKMAKMLKKDDLEREAQERKELQTIRREKLQLLREKLKKEGKNRVRWEDVNRKIEWLLPYVCEPAAHEYLKIIQQKSPEICQQIMKYLFHPEDIKRLDNYIYRVKQVGHGPKNKIKLQRVIKIERAIRKIKPKIQIERDGERIDISQKLRGRQVA